MSDINESYSNLWSTIYQNGSLVIIPNDQWQYITYYNKVLTLFEQECTVGKDYRRNV